MTVEIKGKAAFAHADEVATNVFDFGPNGTTFQRPVAKTLDLATTVPSGIDGTATFNADQCFAAALTKNIHYVGKLPDSCVASGQTCASLAKPGESTAQDDGTTCSVTGSNTDATTAGSPVPCCVTGSTLVLVPHSSSGPDFQLTATRQ